MHRLPEPEAVIIAIVDDDPWGAEGAAAADRVGRLEARDFINFFGNAW